MKRYLAVDIGASSGRHIVGFIQDGTLRIDEVYRFKNGTEEKDGHLVWNTDALYFHVKEGMKEAFEKYGEIDAVSVDTWAVDYVLMRGEKEVFPCYGYRDSRTEAVIPEVHSVVPFSELYSRTGIQFQPFNTIYQLYADKMAGRLEGVTDVLMLPTYLMYKLTGIKAMEYTNATSTGLVNAETNDFDEEILAKLGIPREILGKIVPACTVLGPLKDEVAAEVGGQTTVVLCATHDTASAVLAAPIGTDCSMPYISSGTWSLLGIEQPCAHTDAESMRNNFTNEGAPGGFYRYQKNIMGLWMLQSARSEMHLGFNEAEDIAKRNPCDAVVDCNDNVFLSPKSMCRAVRDMAGVPLTDGELLYCIYNSLAHCYRDAIGELCGKLGKKYTGLRIIGGGSRDMLLNRLTSSVAGVTVFAGPTEGTALGNLVAQMLALGEIKTIGEGRDLISVSFVSVTI